MNWVDALVLFVVILIVVLILYFKYFFHRKDKKKYKNSQCRSCERSKEILADEMKKEYFRNKVKDEKEKIKEARKKADIPQADIDMLNENKKEY